jgi:hypothetical protein
MAAYIRKAISGSLSIVVVLIASFAMVGTLAMAQGGTAATSSSAPPALTGLPAWYACTYGHWGCPEPASSGAGEAREGMSAFYACEYGHWQCPPAPALAADPVGDGLPALYACTYGDWGCP